MAIREIVDCADFDLSVCLTTNQEIRQYNRQLRRVDKPTDVLSLPFIEKLNPGLKPIPIHDDFKNLGDILISPEYVMEQCSSLGCSLHDRLPFLCIHGICHLLGYDHETDPDHDLMQQRENQILHQLIQRRLYPSQLLHSPPPNEKNHVLN